jgi:hypothetical protein
MMSRQKRMAKLLPQLQALGERAIQGSLVEVRLTCGTPTCGCHQDPDRRHGPHLYLRYRDGKGRSRSLYVPRSHEGEVREAVEAWGRMREAMLELSQSNREALRERLRRRSRG